MHAQKLINIQFSANLIIPEEMRWSTYTYRKGAVPMSKTNHTCTVVDNHLVVIGGQSCGVTDMKSTTSPSFTDTFVLNTSNHAQFFIHIRIFWISNAFFIPL